MIRSHVQAGVAHPPARLQSNVRETCRVPRPRRRRGWPTLSRGIVPVVLLNCDGRMTTPRDTTSVVEVEVDCFSGLPLLLRFPLPHSRLSGVGRRGCATVAQAMRNKLERRYGGRRRNFAKRPTRRMYRRSV